MSNLADYINFEFLITKKIVIVMYIVGFILLEVFGIMVIKKSGLINILLGLAIFIFGNIVWRLICEGVIIIFNINDNLVKLNDKR